MSLRWRLIGGIVLLLSALWAATAVWFLFDVRSELHDVLDARLAASAQMVQGLLERGDLRLPATATATFASAAAAPRPPLPNGLTCQLRTLGGRLISASGGAPALGEGSIPDGFSTRMAGGQSWRVFALTAPDNGLRIITAERQGLRAALVGDMALAVAVPFLLVLPLMIALVWVAVGQGLMPLKRLRRSIQARHAQALEPLSEEGVPPEVAPLVGALNGLFARLSSAFERERRFTDDAAHELRTPLAGIKTQLQVARASEGSIRERALAQADRGLDRMTQLVNQILLLARLEARPDTPDDPDACDVDDATTSVLDDLHREAAQRDIRLHRHGDARGAPAALPAAMLHTALRNLVENAIHYSPAGGQVDIETRVTATHLLVQVHDQGPGMSRQALARAHDRFYRGATNDGPGAGLGLSIVAAIAHRYGLTLRLANREPAAGLAASLDIPRAETKEQSLSRSRNSKIN